VADDSSPAASASGESRGIAPHVVPPRVIKSDGTEYPAGGFRLTVRRQDLGTALSVEGEEGTVGVRALVRADGTVERVEITASSGSPVLDRAAATAVARWLFASATRDGVPIEAYVTFKVRYVVR
jgi:TonB family protein